MDNNADNGKIRDEISAAIDELLNSESYESVKEYVRKILEELPAFLEYYKDDIEALQASSKPKQDLAGFIEFELRNLYQKGETDFTLAEILYNGIDDEGNPTDSKYRDIVERAIEKKKAYDQANSFFPYADTDKSKNKDLLRIFSEPANLLTAPLDKVNSNIWGILAGIQDNGQIGFDFEAITSKKGSKKKAVVYAGINFADLDSDLKITQQLTPFDKRVHMAAAALANSKNGVASSTQIYKTMGNRGQPKSSDIQRINESLNKMNTAHVYINNSQEVKINKGYPVFKYDGSLLPFERVSVYINNTLCESAIHFFREPPLMTFARERKQITQIPRQLLESPISKTDANLRIEDYLIERIGHMKNPKFHADKKILFGSLYKKCGITTAKQIQRAPKKIYTYLDWYKQQKFIKDYVKGEDCVIISP